MPVRQGKRILSLCCFGRWLGLPGCAQPAAGHTPIPVLPSLSRSIPQLVAESMRGKKDWINGSLAGAAAGAMLGLRSECGQLRTCGGAVPVCSAVGYVLLAAAAWTCSAAGGRAHPSAAPHPTRLPQSVLCLRPSRRLQHWPLCLRWLICLAATWWRTAFPTAPPSPAASTRTECCPRPSARPSLIGLSNPHPRCFPARVCHTLPCPHSRR